MNLVCRFNIIKTRVWGVRSDEGSAHRYHYVLYLIKACQSQGNTHIILSFPALWATCLVWVFYCVVFFRVVQFAHNNQLCLPGSPVFITTMEGGWCSLPCHLICLRFLDMNWRAQGPIGREPENSSVEPEWSCSKSSKGLHLIWFKGQSPYSCLQGPTWSVPYDLWLIFYHFFHVLCLSHVALCWNAGLLHLLFVCFFLESSSPRLLYSLIPLWPSGLYSNVLYNEAFPDHSNL